MHLPKCRLPNAGRAVHFRHLSAHKPTLGGMSRERAGAQQLVKFGEARGDGGRAARVFAMEGIEGGHGRQPVWKAQSAMCDPWKRATRRGLAYELMLAGSPYGWRDAIHVLGRHTRELLWLDL